MERPVVGTISSVVCVDKNRLTEITRKQENSPDGDRGMMIMLRVTLSCHTISCNTIN